LPTLEDPDAYEEDHSPTPNDRYAYDIYQYLPAADRGSILVTTRLFRLRELGKALELKKVDKDQATIMLVNHMGRSLEG
jgi:hypothetical protein